MKSGTMSKARKKRKSSSLDSIPDGPACSDDLFNWPAWLVADMFRATGRRSHDAVPQKRGKQSERAREGAVGKYRICIAQL